jgi:hypothetical protein
MESRVQKLVSDRLNVGWERYGRGVLHPANDDLNFRQEAFEEILDFVIYATADLIRKKPQVSANISYDDDGEVKLGLIVNYESTRDGNDAVERRIRSLLTDPYSYGLRDPKEDLVNLGLLTLNYIVRETPEVHSGRVSG